MDKLQQLKAQAYDLLANIEFLQSKLRETNNEIAKLAAEKQNNDGSADNSNAN